MKLQTRPLRSKADSSRREERDGLRWLVQGLNGDAVIFLDSKAVLTDELQEILACLVKIDGLTTELRAHVHKAEPKEMRVKWPKRVEDTRLTEIAGMEWPNWRFKDKGLRELSEKGEGIVARLNRLLATHQRFPSILVNQNLQVVQENNWVPFNSVEECALEILLGEQKKGNISRFRRCDRCEKWFYAVTHHQRFHAEACRKQYASRSDEYKTKRRSYMRDYRKREKDEYLRALTSVRISRKAVGLKDKAGRKRANATKLKMESPSRGRALRTTRLMSE